MPGQPNSPLHGSGKPVSDFSSFCEGDIDPTLNKKIQTLIDSEDDYLVYLDDESYVEWSWTESYGETPQGFAEVANKVAHLETLSSVYLKPNQLAAFRRMLGEAMARIVGDKHLTKAQESLAVAESFLNARSMERARTWYLEASALVTGGALVLAAGLWLFRQWMIPLTGQNPFEVLVGCLFGAVGSFMSIWMRPGKIQMDAGAGPAIHRWEGSARIFIGMACAFAVALGIKANIIFGFTKSSDHPFAYVLVICVAAGFSERLFMNLIGHFDDPTLKANRKEKV